MHERRHPLAGVDVMLLSDEHPVSPVHIDDWLDHVQATVLPTAAATPAALTAMWDDDEDVVYGHIGSLGVIVHVSEIGWIVHGYVHAADLLAAWKEDS